MSQTPRHINTDRSLSRPGQAARAPQAAPEQNTRSTAGAQHAPPPRRPAQPDMGGNDAPRRRKKKKKTPLWLPFAIVMGVIAVISGVVVYGVSLVNKVEDSIRPAESAPSIVQEIQTAEEYKGDVVNILVCGIDFEEGRSYSDASSNDGMTDMILYCQFDIKGGALRMLQIPRNSLVATQNRKITLSNGKTYAATNYQINSVALSNGGDIAALAEVIYDQYKLPIDGFITIRLEMLTELVDLFGGVEINVPMDVDYAALGLGDSVIHAGYQTLNGASMEFLLRARKIYPDGDIGRLNMQRQFYAALFRKLKSIGNIWDVAKLTPAVLNYMETNLSASDLISFAISMLKIDSSKIMICQMPVISGPQYNGQSLLYPARQADADLLNQYFRENTGPVDASQLNLCDNVIDLSGYTATDPKIQQMGGLMAEADDAQKNDNLDGSNQVTDIMASESTAESESTDTDSTDTESQPAA